MAVLMSLGLAVALRMNKDNEKAASENDFSEDKCDSGGAGRACL